MTDVLYVAWNRLAFTRESFTALLKNTNWECVGTLYVHDDGSTDGTAEWLKGVCDGFDDDGSGGTRVVYDGTRLGGPVAAMNWYLDGSDPAVERFAKIDNDFVVCPGWINALQQVLDDYHELDIVGTEPWFGEPIDATFHRTYISARHIGGKGVMRRRAFKQTRPTPGGWNGYQGFTQWQEGNPFVTKGWVKPDLACFGLDQMRPADGPWRKLAEGYAEHGWQRMWDPYASDEHYVWWTPEFEIT